MCCRQFVSQHCFELLKKQRSFQAILKTDNCSYFESTPNVVSTVQVALHAAQAALHAAQAAYKWVL